MFGYRLKSLRESKGIVQKELAKELELTIGAISNFERESRNPDNEMLVKIANYFDVSTDYLLGRTINHKESVSISQDDEKEIKTNMEKIKDQLKNDEGLMFDGEILDEETARLFLESIEQTERIIKAMNKKSASKGEH